MARGAERAMAGDAVLTFAALLKRLRRLAGLTQEELAEHAGYSPAYISALERGVRTPLTTTAELLAESLDLDAEARARLIAAGSRDAAQSRRGGVPGHPPTEARTRLALIGRGRELGRIERHLSGAAAPVLLLAGEPGIGKSRLLQEAAARAAESGYTVLQAGCQRHSIHQAYAPLIDALADYLERLPPAELHRTLEGCDWLVRLMPELADVLPMPPLTLPPDQERRLAFRAMGRLLKNVTGAVGALLLLDDLHWAGQDALDLLASLIYNAAGPRLAVIAAYRDTELTSDSPLSVLMADLASARLADHLALGPLSHEASLELLRALLANQGERGSAAHAHYLERLASRAEGVAFFLVSSAESFKTGVDPDEVPWDMAQGIRQRVASLPAKTQELLGIVAVAGRRVSTRVLLAASGLVDVDMVPALAMATAARLLEQEGVSDYRFGHDVVREVVEGDLSTPHRIVLHRRIAEALEEEGAAVEVVAYHYARSGQSEKTITYLERAGDKARSEYAYAAAIEFYRELLARLGSVGRPAEGARVREKLGETLVAAARYDEAVQVLEEAAEVYTAGGDWEGEARTVARLGYAHFRRGTASEGIARLEPLLAAVGDRESSGIDVRTQMDVEFALTHLYYIAQRFQESLESMLKVAELARRIGDVAMGAEAEVVRGIVLCTLRSPQEGARVLEAALPAAKQSGALRTRENGLQVLAGVYLTQGKLEEGMPLLEQAIALAEAQEDRATLALHLALLARYRFVAGDWPEAHVYIDHAVDIARSIGPAWYTGLPLTQLGVLLHAEGDWDGALQCFDQVLAGATSGRAARGLPLTLIIPAQIDILRGRPKEAADRLDPLVGHAGQDWVYGVSTLATLAWARLEMGEDDAEALAGTALALADRTSNRIDRVGALRVRAMAFHRQGRRDEAMQLFAESMLLASSTPYPYEEGRTLYEWGRALATDGKTQEAHHRLRDALALFRRLGAHKDIELVEQALGSQTAR